MCEGEELEKVQKSFIIQCHLQEIGVWDHGSIKYFLMEKFKQENKWMVIFNIQITNPYTHSLSLEPLTAFQRWKLFNINFTLSFLLYNQSFILFSLYFPAQSVLLVSRIKKFNDAIELYVCFRLATSFTTTFYALFFSIYTQKLTFKNPCLNFPQKFYHRGCGKLRNNFIGKLRKKSENKRAFL